MFIYRWPQLSESAYMFRKFNPSFVDHAKLSKFEILRMYVNIFRRWESEKFIRLFLFVGFFFLSFSF